MKLGFFDHESSCFKCTENPFAAKVLPMSSAPCVRVVVASTLRLKVSSVIPSAV
jgi:hypothetical protein